MGAVCLLVGSSSLVILDSAGRLQTQLHHEWQGHPLKAWQPTVGGFLVALLQLQPVAALTQGWQSMLSAFGCLTWSAYLGQPRLDAPTHGPNYQ
eukprot:7163847-Prorocentrum_lima.AAC.1